MIYLNDTTFINFYFYFESFKYSPVFKKCNIKFSCSLILYTQKLALLNSINNKREKSIVQISGDQNMITADYC